MRVSYVLLLTPFILACGRLPDCNPDHPIPLVYLINTTYKFGEKGFQEGSSPYQSIKAEFRLPLLGGEAGEARGQNADYEGMRAGQRPDGSKVYGRWLYLYLGGCLISNIFYVIHTTRSVDRFTRFDDSFPGKLSLGEGNMRVCGQTVTT